MPLFLSLISVSGKATMWLLCVLGTGFMIWFLVGLIADLSGVSAGYIVRMRPGKGQLADAFADQVGPGPILYQVQIEEPRIDRTSRFPVYAFRNRRHF
jgi:hypothetical protein